MDHYPAVRALYAFRRVVELQSFIEAARDMNMSGGAISKLISGLEDELGVRLLTRTTRRVSPTESGLAYYEVAASVLNQLESATELVRSQRLRPQGRLKVGVPTSFALMVLSSRLPVFVEQFPDIKVDLSLNDCFVDIVEEGFDCAIRIASHLEDSSLVAKALGAAERLIVASPIYLARHGVPQSPSELTKHSCLLYSLSATSDSWPLTNGNSSAPVYVTGQLCVNNSMMLRHALLSGLGLALVPRFAVADLLTTGQLIEVLEAFRPIPHHVYGMLPNRKHLPHKVELFLGFVRSCIMCPEPSSYGTSI
ncbi:MAG: LysR family transcriptional regulator [Burkholderiaceae bacterium]|nr:LysR family transcriptional regulator [Burkholderiaceae bacterium]